MQEAGSGWYDAHVGAPVVESLLEHVARGTPRVVLWGPPGVGRTTLLRRLAEALEDRAVLVDAASAAAAREALEEAPRGRPVVVATPSRTAVEADAFVESRPLPIDDGTEGSALAFLRRLLAREDAGRDWGSEEALRTIALHTGGLPGAVRRAAELLRIVPAEGLARRCEAAVRTLVVHGRAAEHPLGLGSPAAIAETDDAQRRAAAALVAAGEPIDVDLAELLVPSGALEALLALRDAGAVRVLDDGRLELSVPFTCAVAGWTGFAEAFGSAARRLDDRMLELGRDAYERWLTRGSLEEIDRLERHAGFLTRATERALEAGESDRARLVQLALAVALPHEVRRRLGEQDELIRRAVEALGDDPLGGPLRIEHARRLRVSGELAAAEQALDELDPDTLPPEQAGRWHAERALCHNDGRRMDASARHFERARDLHAAHGWDHEVARHVINIGSIRYWQERWADAVEHFEQGRSLAARLGAKRTRAIALSNLCLCHSLIGDERLADERGSEAVALFREEPDYPETVGTTLGHLGILAFHYGRLEDAERHFAEAEALLESVRFIEQLRYVRFNRAELAFSAGDLDGATARARSLEVLLEAHPDPMVSISLASLRADIFEARGDLAEARASLEWAHREAGSLGSMEWRAHTAARLARVLGRLQERDASRAMSRAASETIPELPRGEQRAALTLILEHASLLRGEPVEGAPALAAALRPAWEGRRVRARIGVSVVDSSAVRIAAAAYWRDAPSDLRVAVEWSARDPDATALCLDRDGGRARVPGGAIIEATTRRNAHRLLVLLAGASPEPRARDELIAQTWPGERMLGRAALNRLHNALAQLRSFGLADYLLHEEGSYRLAGLRVIDAGASDPFALDGSGEPGAAAA